MKYDISFCILAGGKGSRFGGGKYKLSINGIPLIQHLIDRFKDHVSEIFIVAKKDFDLQVEDAAVIFDQFDSYAPVFGIITALNHIKSRKCLVLACDMPFISPKIIGMLYKGKGDALIVVPDAANELQMLCALYDRDLLPLLKKRADDGKLALHELVKLVPTVVLKRFTGTQIKWFENINYQEDLRKVDKVDQKKVNPAL